MRIIFVIGTVAIAGHTQGTYRKGLFLTFYEENNVISSYFCCLG